MQLCLKSAALSWPIYEGRPARFRSPTFRYPAIAQVKVSCYFIELYLDNLRDLLWAMEHTRGTPPKLEVHMDPNKMVVVKNVVTKVGRLD